METDEWVKNALADDSLVVELLLRLKQSTAAPSQLPPRPKQLSWGTRQPRSKPAPRKERDPMMIFSPTTPLSWSSGATAAAASSPSDDSCRPSDLSSGSRSKGTCANDSIACSSANKNLKRKKSFNETHEEESLLIKERIQLKNGLEPPYATTEMQNVNIENSKRLKTDLHQELASSEIASKTLSPEVLNFNHIKAADGTRIDNVPASNNINIYGDDSAAVNPSKPERGFVLPDLNMTPPEDENGFC